MPNLKVKSINAIIWTLIEKFGNQIFGLVIGVILARLLTPKDYGLIGMITVFFGLATVFVNSGFGSAFIQKKDANQIDASTVFFFNIFASIFFYVIFWFSAPLIADFYNQKQLINLTRIAAILLIINSFGMMQNAKLSKEVDFKKKSIISLISNVISGILGIIAAINDFGVWSLVIQQIFKAFFNVIGLWIFYKWRPSFVFNIESLKTMFSFSSWMLLSSLIKTVFDNIYILTIGKFFPVSQLGFYTKAQDYQTVLIKQPTMAVSTVTFPVFSSLQNDKNALKKSMEKFTAFTLFFVCFIGSMIFVVAYPLVELVLTAKWMPMVPFFQILLIIGMMFPLQNFNISLLNAQGNSKLVFRVSIFKNFLRLINIFIFYRSEVINILWGELILSFLTLFLVGYFAKKSINYGTYEQIMDVYKNYLCVVISILVGYIVNYLNLNIYFQLFSGIFLTTGVYFVCQFYLNRKLFLESWGMIEDTFLNFKK